MAGSCGFARVWCFQKPMMEQAGMRNVRRKEIVDFAL